MNKAKFTRLNSLLKKLNKQAYKIDYVVDVTNGRSQSSKDLTDQEYWQLIKVLENELVAHQSAEQPNPDFEKANRMRRKILSMCHEMGMHLPGTTKIDMAEVNKTCIAHSYLKKELNNYTNEELPKLVSQFELILKTYYKKA